MSLVINDKHYHPRPQTSPISVSICREFFIFFPEYKVWRTIFKTFSALFFNECKVYVRFFFIYILFVDLSLT